MKEAAPAAKMYICGDALQNFQKSDGTVLNCCYTFKIIYKKGPN